MSRSTSHSANKKQDEKNLKTLRDLVSLQVNKQCFDCQQRGPTYVNTTIGSFVCTSCSGRLYVSNSCNNCTLGLPMFFLMFQDGV